MNEGLFMYLHKLAADLTGLGSVENDLLLTSEINPGINWGTVLTDAPLEAK